MADPLDAVRKRLDQFADSVGKEYGRGKIGRGGTFKGLEIERFSSGSISLDLALGGGWPFGRIGLIWGPESAGKTLLATMAFREIERFCSKCHKAQEKCVCRTFVPCVGMYVDQEGAFDIDWARRLGFSDENHLVYRPEFAEESIDVISTAIEDGTVDLIVIDSIAAMTPKAEIEHSTEDWQIGLGARLVNKAMRKWVSALNKKGQGGPTLLCINQMRTNIGVKFGDPETMPHGRGQRFSASTILRLRTAKVTDGDEKVKCLAEIHGSTQKNKTFTPRQEFTFIVTVKDLEQARAGTVFNASQLVSLGQRYDLVKKMGSTYMYEGLTGKTVGELAIKLEGDDAKFRQLWDALIVAATT